jgi:hypothetical protein
MKDEGERMKTAGQAVLDRKWLQDVIYHEDSVVRLGDLRSHVRGSFGLWNFKSEISDFRFVCDLRFVI